MMTISKKTIARTLAIIGLLPGAILWSTESHAACSVSEGGSNTVPTLNVSSTVSAGLNAPVGTVLYHIYTRNTTVLAPSGDFRIRCNVLGNFYEGTEITNVLFPQSSYQTPGYIVYNTNVPGVGARIEYLATPVALSGCRYALTCGYWDLPPGTAMTTPAYALIKTGPITPGNVDLNQIPRVRWTMGQSNSMVPYSGGALIGSVQVMVPTCALQQVNREIPLGSHEISHTFTAPGSASAWKNTGGIVLNCGDFSGKQASPLIWNNTDGYTSVPARTNNRYLIRFSAANGSLDVTRGIIALDNSDNAATGIGIQLATEASESAAIKPDTNIIRNLPLNSPGNITFPVYARYIQTGNEVTPGPANGKVTFTISYE